MIDRALDMLKTGLEHPTYGIAFQLRQMARGIGYDCPPTPIVLTSVGHPEISDGDFGQDLDNGVVAIRQDTDAAVTVEGVKGSIHSSVDVTFVFAYATRDKVENRANRDAYEIMWAIVRVLRVLFRPANVSARALNGALLERVEPGQSILWGETREEVNGGTINAHMRVRCRIQDQQPLGV